MHTQSLTREAPLQHLIHRNRKGEAVGIYSICSAHPSVIAAGMQQALDDASLLLIESTCSQVNQFGGYSGQTPAQFAARVRSAAHEAGLPHDNLILGGDHLGPYPWKSEPAKEALHKAAVLVRECVLAGYTKIHLDASMACADDVSPILSDETIAERAALLCQEAENAHRELPPGAEPLLYVIGSEVPTPGGETAPGEPPAVTTVANLHRTLDVFHKTFERHGLSAAWERVIGVVVQPGVEFGENVVFSYDRNKASALLTALPEHHGLAYEAHSTDYQTPVALRQLVEDHFAILKVGPGLTFAYREAIFALSAIERELCGARRNENPSDVRGALEAAMLRNPSYWRGHYHGTEDDQKFARIFSFSDRCRYYWNDSSVQEELRRLVENLSRKTIPMPLIGQYLPLEYRAIQKGGLKPSPESLVQHHVRTVMRDYSSACGTLRPTQD